MLQSLEAASSCLKTSSMIMMITIMVRFANLAVPVSQDRKTSLCHLSKQSFNSVFMLQPVGKLSLHH